MYSPDADDVDGIVGFTTATFCGGGTTVSNVLLDEYCDLPLSIETSDYT